MSDAETVAREIALKHLAGECSCIARGNTSCTLSEDIAAALRARESEPHSECSSCDAWREEANALAATLAEVRGALRDLYDLNVYRQDAGPRSPLRLRILSRHEPLPAPPGHPRRRRGVTEIVTREERHRWRLLADSPYGQLITRLLDVVDKAEELAGAVYALRLLGDGTLEEALEIRKELATLMELT